MKNLVKRMFHNGFSYFRCSLAAETTAFGSEKHLSSTNFFFFSWVKFGELHSWKTELVVILVRRLAMPRVNTNVFKFQSCLCKIIILRGGALFPRSSRAQKLKETIYLNSVFTLNNP